MMQLRKIKPKKTIALKTRGQKVGLVVASLLLGLVRVLSDRIQKNKQPLSIVII